MTQAFISILLKFVPKPDVAYLIDADPLRAREPAHADGEDADPACGAGLDERQRRERERRDVETPAADAREEAGEPAAVPEELQERVQRPPQRQRRQRRRVLVLQRVPAVDRNRGGHGEHEPGRDHWNGR